MRQSGEALSLSEAFEKIDYVKDKMHDFGVGIQQGDMEEIIQHILEIDIQGIRSLQHDVGFVNTYISALDHIGEYGNCLKNVIRCAGDIAFSDTDQDSELNREAVLCWERLLNHAAKPEFAIENGVDWGAQFIWDEMEDRAAQLSDRQEDLLQVKEIWKRTNVKLLTCYNSCGAIEAYIKKAAITNDQPFQETSQVLLSYLNAHNWCSYGLKPNQMH